MALKFNPITGSLDLVNAVVAGSTSDSFKTINTPNGTDPVATTSTDTLNLTSVDSSVTITGNSATKTVDIVLANTISGDRTFTDEILANGGVDVTATGATDVLNIGTTNADTINIGHAGATVNIQGTTVYQDVTNSEITDKNITINKDGGAATATSAGIEIEEGGSITGYIRTSGDRNDIELKAPNQAGIAVIDAGAAGITLNQSSHNPVTIGTANGLSVDGSQAMSMALAASGTTGALSGTDYDAFDAKVDGPASATDNTLPRFDGTTGKLIQGSSVVVDDSNNVSGIANLTATGTTTLNTSLSGVVKAALGVISASAVVNADVDAAAAIARTKLAAGNAYRILANDASGVMSENATITASRAVASDANGQLVASATTATELGYVSGVTSALQTQINAKRDKTDDIDLTSEVTGMLPVANQASQPKTQDIYCDKNRVDSYTEDGSITRPYKTLEAALAAITDATASKQYAVRLAPGIYTMAAGSKLNPYVHIIGSGREVTIIATTGGATIIDMTGATARLLLQDIHIQGASGLTVDRTGASGGAWFGMFGCSVSGPVTYNGKGSGFDFFEAHQNFYYGSSFTINGVSSILNTCTFYGTLDVGSAGATVADSYSYYSLFSAQGCYIAGNLTASSASTKPTGIQLFQTMGDGTWTFTGTASLDIYIDGSSGPLNGNTVTKTGTVNTYRYGYLNNLGYTPTTSGNWSSVPNNVQSALDTIASDRVTGPASATDNAVVRYDGTTGKLIQNSSVTVDDSGNLAANNLSGTNTGDVTVSDTNTVDLALTGQALTANVLHQDTDSITMSDDASGLKADLNLSAAAAGAGNTKVTLSIENDGLLAQVNLDTALEAKLIAARRAVVNFTTSATDTDTVTTEVTAAATTLTPQATLAAKGVYTGAVSAANDAKRVLVRASGTDNGIDDGTGDEVYAVLSEAAGVYTLTYKKANGTNHSFGAPIAIDFYFVEISDLMDIPVDSIIQHGVTGVVDATTSSALNTHIADTTDAHDASAISNTPSGNLAATDVQSALNELQTDIDTRALDADLTAHISDAADAHDASAISVVASGNLVATDAQAAFDELQGDVDTLNTDLAAHLSDATDAHDASAVSVVASGNLAATDVQGAVDELQGDIDTLNTDLAAHIGDATDAHDASAISVVASGNLAATDVQAAVDELQADIDTRALDADLDAHIADVSGAHAASAISLALADGSKKNIQAASDDVETAIVDLDNAIGALDATPSNYSATDAAIVADHLAGIDAKLDHIEAQDIADTAFALADNQAAAADVTGLAFANASVRGAKIEYSITVDATADLFEKGTLEVIQKGASWELSREAVGDDSLVDITITNAGQLQYTSPAYAGFVSAKIQFRAVVNQI